MNTKKVIKDIGIVTVLLGLRSVVGFIRDVVMASRFALDYTMDAFNIASKVPLTIANLLVMGVFTAVFLPIFTRYIIENKKEELNKLVGILFIIITVGFTVLIILAEIFARPFIMYVLTNNATAETVDEAIVLFRLMMPAVLLMAWSGLASGIHNSFQRFTMPAVGNLLFNIWMVLPAWIFPQSWGIRGFAVGVCIGALFQLLVQLPGLFGKHMKLDINFNMRHPALMGIGSLVIPVLLSSSINYLVPFVETFLASGIANGAVSALAYAFRISQLPLGIFVLAISSVVYPLFAEAVAKNNPEALKSNIQWGLKLVVMIIIPAGFGLLALSHPIVMMLFQRGKFGIVDTVMTSAPLAFYGLAIIPMAIEAVLVKVFYSISDTKTPVKIYLSNLIMLVILDVVFVKMGLGVVGLALGATICAFVRILMVVIAMRKKIGIFGLSGLMVSIIKSTVASIVMSIVAYLIAIRANYVVNLGSNFGRSLQVGFAIVVGVAVYAVVLYIIDRKEINQMLVVFKRRGQSA
ncbi:MAG TPA: murein biosynthesis integral membrane protein MurJ [Caldisericia bacterium]|nr:murein biosynthesis integral membrane protein MurJ [Caldisericia bacterium]HOR46123.1 murein biosynthesis integral membrane protein MurJ [Caldisericia bacterium]